MKRTVTEELLDEDLGTADEIAASLSDLRRINRWFGGMRTTTGLLRRVARQSGCRQLSVLEVGAGRGDVPFAAQRALSREGVGVQITLLDRNWSHLPRNGATAIAGDALCLPLRDASFDVVSCSLLSHHFEPDELRLFVREALRVCRRAVLINDLIRSRVYLGLVYLGFPLFRSRITRHDAPASVRRAYTRKEVRDLLGGTQSRIEVSAHYLYRMGVLVWKQRE